MSGDRQFWWPVVNGVCTLEEAESATFKKLQLYNEIANEKYRSEHGDEE